MSPSRSKSTSIAAVTGKGGSMAGKAQFAIACLVARDERPRTRALRRRDTSWSFEGREQRKQSPFDCQSRPSLDLPHTSSTSEF